MKLNWNFQREGHFPIQSIHQCFIGYVKSLFKFTLINQPYNNIIARDGGITNLCCIWGMTAYNWRHFLFWFRFAGFFNKINVIIKSKRSLVKNILKTSFQVMNKKCEHEIYTVKCEK